MNKIHTYILLVMSYIDILKVLNFVSETIFFKPFHYLFIYSLKHCILNLNFYNFKIFYFNDREKK